MNCSHATLGLVTGVSLIVILLVSDVFQDPEKSKIKQLQRQIKREHKGAMRELKRDSVFLERAKADIAAEKEAERLVQVFEEYVGVVVCHLVFEVAVPDRVSHWSEPDNLSVSI